MHRPILGQGLGTRQTGEDNPLRNAPILDNQWLGLFLDVGLVGLFGWIWLIVRSVRRLGRVARTRGSPEGMLAAAFAASITGFAVAMLTYDALAFVQAAFVFWVILALSAVLVRAHSTTPPPACERATAAVSVRRVSFAPPARLMRRAAMPRHGYRGGSSPFGASPAIGDAASRSIEPNCLGTRVAASDPLTVSRPRAKDLLVRGICVERRVEQRSPRSTGRRWGGGVAPIRSPRHARRRTGNAASLRGAIARRFVDASVAHGARDPLRDGSSGGRARRDRGWVANAESPGAGGLLRFPARASMVGSARR